MPGLLYAILLMWVAPGLAQNGKRVVEVAKQLVRANPNDADAVADLRKQMARFLIDGRRPIRRPHRDGITALSPMHVRSDVKSSTFYPPEKWKEFRIERRDQFEENAEGTTVVISPTAQGFERQMPQKTGRIKRSIKQQDENEKTEETLKVVVPLVVLTGVVAFVVHNVRGG